MADAKATASATSTGVNAFAWLGVILVVLKLDPESKITTDVVNWPWWLVTLPLWGGLALVLTVLAIFGIVAGTLGAVDAYSRHKRRKRLAAEREARVLSANESRAKSGYPPFNPDRFKK